MGMVVLGAVVDEEVVVVLEGWVVVPGVPGVPRDLASAAVAMAILRSAREVVEVGVAGVAGAGGFGVMVRCGVQYYLRVIVAWNR